jgi:hypothetical protein
MGRNVRGPEHGRLAISRGRVEVVLGSGGDKSVGDVLHLQTRRQRLEIPTPNRLYHGQIERMFDCAMLLFLTVNPEADTHPVDVPERGCDCDSDASVFSFHRYHSLSNSPSLRASAWHSNVAPSATYCLTASEPFPSSQPVEAR